MLAVKCGKLAVLNMRVRMGFLIYKVCFSTNHSSCQSLGLGSGSGSGSDSGSGSGSSSGSG